MDANVIDECFLVTKQPRLLWKTHNSAESCIVIEMIARKEVDNLISP